MEQIIVLNFYDFLKVEIPKSLFDNYFVNFISDENFEKTNYSKLIIRQVDKIILKDSVLVSNYMCYSLEEEKIYLIDKNGKKCQSIFGELNNNSIKLKCEKGFNPEFPSIYIIKPVLRRILLKNDCAFIHASSFAYQDQGILIAAWAHTGKTNSLLINIQNGASYLGDDLSVIGKEGVVYPFPVPINLFYYNLRDIPETRKNIGSKNRIKFWTTKKIAKVFALLNRLAKNQKMKYLFYAGKTFFDSASHVPFKLSNEFNNTGKNNYFPVKKCFLLERTENLEQSFRILRISPDLFAERMQQCINYEFQRFNELVTSAKWVPFYNGSDLNNNKELEIYKNFAEKTQLSNIQISRKFDFHNQKFFDLLNS